MEVATIVAAHQFDDLENDIKALVAEINEEESEAAIQGLLHRVTEATVRFAALKNDYLQWRRGTKITPQTKLKFARHVELFHRLLTKATGTLARLGHSVECPPYPHTPIPTVNVLSPEATNEAILSAPSASAPSTNLRREDDEEDETFVAANETLKETLSNFRNDNLSPQLQPTSQRNLPSPPRQFLFPEVQGAEDSAGRSLVSPTPSSSKNLEDEIRATAADLDAGEALQRREAVSRVEREEEIKREADRQIREDQREEEELLKKAEDIRRRRESLSRRAEERLERVKREERERLEEIQAQNKAIKHDLYRGRMSPATHQSAVDNELTEVEGLIDVTPRRSPKVNRPVGDVTKDYSDGHRFSIPASLRLPLKPTSPLDKSILEVGECKSDVNHIIADMASIVKEQSRAFKEQSERMNQLAASHIQLQNEMKDLLKATSHLKVAPVTSPQISAPNSPIPAAVDTLLAHSRLADTRPPPEERWKGGGTLKRF